MMKILPIAIVALPFVAGCNSTPDTNTHDHWNLQGVGPSVTRAALGFDPERDGKYIDYQYENKRSIYLTVQRHFLNHNPANPFEYEDENFYAPRPTHSIVPRPWEYINFEGLVWGGIIAAGTAGTFIPIPVDSVIGSMSEGGGDEFVQGINETFFGGEGRVKAASYLHQDIGLETAAH